MRLLSLSLQNIKSYADETTIQLTAGLNAICGRNGAGKTTVLEAIGFALFDFLPYAQGAFVREGEKTGTVRVRLEAPDGRVYEVARGVGAGSLWEVIDVEHGESLARRAEAVKRWICAELLDVEGEVDLPALFSNAVGVPQGTMTADFLKIASGRKHTFDPLLRVDEYETAWSNLRDTERHLKDTLGDLRQEIGRLQGETERMSEVEERVARLRGSMVETERALGRLAGRRAEIERRREVLDAAEAALVGLRRRLHEAELAVERAEGEFQMRAESWERARAAHGAMLAVRTGYMQYREAQEALQRLEASRQERDGVRAALANVTAARDASARLIAVAERELRELLRAEEAAATLDDACRRQDELEEQIGVVAREIESVPAVEKELEQLNTDIAAIEALRASRDDRIREAQAARTLLDGAERVEQARRDLDLELAELEAVARQMAEVREAGTRLREAANRLRPQAERRATLEERRPLAAARAAVLDELRAEHGRVRERLAGVDAALEYHDRAQLDLSRRHCPLLDLECPALQHDPTLLVRFETQAQTLARGRSADAAHLREVEESLAEAEAAMRELVQLDLDLAGLAGAAERLSEREKELDEHLERYRALEARLAGREDAVHRREVLDVELRRLQASRERVASLPALEEQRAGEAVVLQRHVANRDRLLAQREELRGARERFARLTDELTALDNPRKRQTDLAARAARLPEAEQELANERERWSAAEAQCNELTERLRAFETLEAELTSARAAESEHRPAYEVYLQNSAEAEQLAGREEALAGARATRDEAVHAAEAARREEEAASTAYDRPLHERLKREDGEVRSAIELTTGERTRLASEVETVERELRGLRSKRERMGALAAEAEELEAVGRAVAFIRATIREAGPAVTEMLLANISRTASDIYSEVMDDHASELRWDSLYEVLVQRGAETRTFAQLSGGEQMSAALAVRLALLRELSGVDFAAFDEPTQNMDADRRSNLASQIAQVKGFEQLIVISHDDTFEQQTDTLVRLRKVGDRTELERE